MIIGSTKENLSLEKRVSLTPETAVILLIRLKVVIESEYAHTLISDKEFESVGVEQHHTMSLIL